MLMDPQEQNAALRSLLAKFEARSMTLPPKVAEAYNEIEHETSLITHEVLRLRAQVESLRNEVQHLETRRQQQQLQRSKSGSRSNSGSGSFIRRGTPPRPTSVPKAPARLPDLSTTPNSSADNSPINGRTPVSARGFSLETLRGGSLKIRGTSMEEVIAVANETPLPQEEGLVYARDKDQIVLRGGTVDALISKVTAEGKAYADIFLITYRSFIEPMALFEALVERYQNAANDEQGHVTRLKVISFFRNWIDNYFHDWEEVDNLFDRYCAWAAEVKKDIPAIAQHLEGAVKRKAAQQQVGYHKRGDFDQPAPKPIRPPVGFTRVTDIDPTELARQLCVIESRLFQSITPKEYLGKAWEKKDKETRAPNLTKLIRHTNKTSMWVATTIIEVQDERKRPSVIEFWIKVAEKLAEMNNFLGVMEMIGGLGNNAVARLKKTWKNVSKAKMSAWKKIYEIMSPQKSYSLYRGSIRNAHGPVIPYLGIYFQDITFIEDGGTNFLKDYPNYVNFQKRKLLAEVIRDIQQHQLAPYNLEPVDEIIDFILLAQPEDDDTLFNKSLIICPREPDN